MPGVPRETDACPILRPTKAQFEKPFLKFASDYFLKNPNVPIIKVIPPTGFKARSKAYDLDNLTIDTPIEQRVRNGVIVPVSQAATQCQRRMLGAGANARQ